MSDAIDGASSLEEKAEAMEQLLWEHCRSPEGLVYCFVMADTLRRVATSDIAAVAPDPDALTKADLRYGSETLEVATTADGPQYAFKGKWFDGWITQLVVEYSMSINVFNRWNWRLPALPGFSSILSIVALATGRVQVTQRFTPCMREG